MWELFTVTAPSRTAVNFLETNWQRRTQIYQRPFIYYIQLLAMALWTNLEPVANGAVTFLNPECCFSLWASAQWKLCDIGNGAMKAPHYCQRRNESSAMSRPVRIHWWFFRVNVETQVSLWKSQQRAVYLYGAINFIPVSAMRFRIANSRMRRRS